MKEIAWIDTANQIGNSWYKKSVVGIFFEKSGKFVGVEIYSQHKLKIKDKLKDYNEKDVIGHLQAYLVYLCCTRIVPMLQIERTWLCSDFQPIKTYHNYLQKCFGYHGNSELFQGFGFKCKPKEIKSKAHPKVRKLYRRRRGNPDHVFDKEDLLNFITYFQKQTIRKVKG